MGHTHVFKVSKRQNAIFLGLAIAALVGIFIYQVLTDAAYGSTDKHGSSEYVFPPFEGWNQSSSWIQLSPTTQQHDYNDQRIEYNILSGSTWHIVNSTDGSTSTVSFGIAPPACGYNGHKYDGRNCSWVVSYWNDRLSISFAKKDFELTFQTVSQNHIELTDQHGNTIHLMRGDMSNIGENELVPIPGKSAAYNAGFSQGYIGVPLKGHHTQQYLLGYTNGTSLYESNRGGVFSYNGLPKDKDALYEKGTDLFKLGNYTGAILYYDKTLAIDPKDAHALTNTGVSLFKLGNYTGAIEYFDRALAINPKHENALYNKGLTIYELGNYTEAIGYFDKALAIDPKDEDALYEKGVVLDKLGNHTGAIEDFDKALAINPHDVDALNNKGAALNSIGNYTGAIEFLTSYLIASVVDAPFLVS
jgi:tetratricopeptide (TPR) repeat protein